MKLMRMILVLLALSIAGCGLITAQTTSEKPNAAANSEPSEAEAKIQSAMSAAPMALAKDATIVDYPAKAGQPHIVLREGTNGWTCYPDWEATPGNDPQCFHSGAGAV
jgi:uncharacterized protein YceK